MIFQLSQPWSNPLCFCNNHHQFSFIAIKSNIFSHRSLTISPSSSNYTFKAFGRNRNKFDPVGHQHWKTKKKVSCDSDDPCSPRKHEIVTIKKIFIFYRLKYYYFSCSQSHILFIFESIMCWGGMLEIIY